MDSGVPIAPLQGTTHGSQFDSPGRCPGLICSCPFGANSRRCGFLYFVPKGQSNPAQGNALVVTHDSAAVAGSPHRTPNGMNETAMGPITLSAVCGRSFPGATSAAQATLDMHHTIASVRVDVAFRQSVQGTSAAD